MPSDFGIDFDETNPAPIEVHLLDIFKIKTAAMELANRKLLDSSADMSQVFKEMKLVGFVKKGGFAAKLPARGGVFTIQPDYQRFLGTVTIGTATRGFVGGIISSYDSTTRTFNLIGY